MIFFVTLGFKTSQWTVARGESETCKLMLHVSILCFNMSIKSLEICTAVQAVSNIIVSRLHCRASSCRYTAIIVNFSSIVVCFSEY